MLVTLNTVKPTKFLVQLRFFNNTRANDTLAMPAMLLDGRPTGDHFQFEPRLRYLGSQRKGYSKEELCSFKPGEIIYSEVFDLKEFYDFEDHIKNVKVRYSSSHPHHDESMNNVSIMSKWETLGPQEYPFDIFYPSRRIKEELRK